MQLTIDCYHNVGSDPMKFVLGYQDGDPLVLVDRYTSSSDPANGVMAALEQVFYALNIGDEAGDMQALDYRQRRNRSLSVGDVCIIDGVAYKCASLGWERCTVFPGQIKSYAIHGTTPLVSA